jgi:hypothetical protein
MAPIDIDNRWLSPMSASPKMRGGIRRPVDGPWTAGFDDSAAPTTLAPPPTAPHSPPRSVTTLGALRGLSGGRAITWPSGGSLPAAALRSTPPGSPTSRSAGRFIAHGTEDYGVDIRRRPGTCPSDAASLGHRAYASHSSPLTACRRPARDRVRHGTGPDEDVRTTGCAIFPKKDRR